MTAPDLPLLRAPLTRTFVDLGLQPLANSYCTPSRRRRAEPIYPLHARVCDHCLLVQVERRCRRRDLRRRLRLFLVLLGQLGDALPGATPRTVIERFGSARQSLVIEVASQRRLPAAAFRGDAACRCWASSPPPTRRRRAIAKGMPTEVAFFGAATARGPRRGGAQRRPDRGQQRAGPRARHQRLRRRLRAWC